MNLINPVSIIKIRKLVKRRKRNRIMLLMMNLHRFPVLVIVNGQNGLTIKITQQKEDVQLSLGLKQRK